MSRAAYIIPALAIAFLAAGCKQAGESPTAKAPDSVGEVTAGNITILATLTDQTDRTRAKQNVEDTLTRHPDIDCLVGLWSYNGPMILSAVKDANVQGKVGIICFDEEDDTLQGVKDGHIYATVVQQPYEFGYQSVRMLAALARGEKSVIPQSGILDVPVKIIRPDNVTEFWDNLARLRKNAELPQNTAGSAKVAFVTNNVSDFWTIAKAGIRKAEREFDASCEFLQPPEGRADEQQRMVEALIAKGVSGMAISPNDAENQVEMINRACEAMNVITQDSDAPKSQRLCYVGTSNYLAGREAGKLIKEYLPNGGQIVLFVGKLDAQNAKERRQGIIDELRGEPIPEALAR
jgi:ribose transport system substrate-binding protein